MTPPQIVRAPVASWWKGERGEWYVAIQAALFLLIGFGPATTPSWLPAWPSGTGSISSPVGAILLVGGCVLIIAGAVQLAFGRSFSALPHPRDSATLIDTGAFALVRHPMYSGAIWAAAGWACYTQSLLTLLYGALLAVFFDVKASREERWLVLAFPAYPAYRARVRKLIPFVY